MMIANILFEVRCRDFVLAVMVMFAAITMDARAQTARPTPTPKDDGEVVKISTNLIQVDVTVTDKKGKIITDLRRDEIEVYENGKKQPLTAFSFVSNLRAIAESRKPLLKGEIPPPPTVVQPASVRRTIALVVDDLTMSFRSVYYVRQALKKFVDEQMQPGDMVAIMKTGSSTGTLQQFTSDKRILHAAIENLRWLSSGSGGIDAIAPIEPPLRVGENDSETGERTIEGQEREFKDFRANSFTNLSLYAVNNFIRTMQEMPGRRSLLFFSDGIALTTIDAEGRMETSDNFDPVRRVIDQANRSSVVVYTMDPRGLQPLGLTAVDQLGDRDQEERLQALTARRNEFQSSLDGLVYLARETGGEAFLNNNDLSSGIRDVLNDQSYYLLGYEPDDDVFDTKTRKFNKLEVKVTRPGTLVRYRSGFFGITNDTATRDKGNEPATLAEALTSPFTISDIPVRLNALFGNGATTGTFVRSFVHISTNGLSFTDGANSTKVANLEIVGVAFGVDGQPVDQLAKSFTITMRPDSYATALKNGFLYEFEFPVKKSGAFQYRVVVRDKGSKKIGLASQFIEVPDLSKDRLILSGMLLQNLTPQQWELLSDRRPNGQSVDLPNPSSGTSQRRFPINTILRYGYEIYNSKIGDGKPPALSRKVRVFRDGKLVLDGQPVPVEIGGQTDLKRIKASGALLLGGKMEPGDYVLQIITTDANAKAGRSVATQFVQFEVVS